MSDVKPMEDDLYTGSPMDPNYRLYVPLLTSLGVTIGEHDRLMLGQSPVLVKGEPLVIASNRRMRAGDFQGVVGFHPLSEDIRNGASGVHDRLCSIVAQKLTSSISLLALAIGTIAANPDLQKELTPTALTVIKPLENFDLRALKKLAEFLKNIGPAKTRRLVKLHLRRSYTADGTHYDRVCRVTFPMLEELGKFDDSILGTECRKKDPELLRRLFRIILPDYKTDTSAYHGPSNSTIAPFFDAIVTAYIRVATHINAVVTALADSSEIDEARDLIDLHWMPRMADYDKMLLRMRPLPGNAGAPGLTESRQNAHAAVDIAPPPPAATPTQPGTPTAQPPYPQAAQPAPHVTPQTATAAQPPYPQQAGTALPANVSPAFSKIYPNVDPAKLAATQVPPAVPFGRPGFTPGQQPVMNQNGFLVGGTPATPNGFAPQPAVTPNGFPVTPNGFPATPNGFPQQPVAPGTTNGFAPGTPQFNIPNPYMGNSAAVANGYGPRPMMGGVPIPQQPPHPQMGYAQVPQWQQQMMNTYAAPMQPMGQQPYQPGMAVDPYGRAIQPAPFMAGAYPVS